MSNQAHSAARTLAQPAPTVVFGARINDVSVYPDISSARLGQPIPAAVRDACGAMRLPLSAASGIQSFPAQYPWAGTRSRRFLQCGNAVPPVLACVVVEAAGAQPVP